MAEDIVIIECQKCGKEIGIIEKVEGQELLKIGSIKYTFSRGVCDCGEPFYWDVGQQALARLIRRSLEQKKRLDDLKRSSFVL